MIKFEVIILDYEQRTVVVEKIETKNENLISKFIENKYGSNTNYMIVHHLNVISSRGTTILSEKE